MEHADRKIIFKGSMKFRKPITILPMENFPLNMS